MANIPILTSADGVRITVQETMANPKRIPRRVLDMTQNEFFIDALLRNEGSIPGGVITYHESTPLYSDEGPFITGEGAEIQVMTGQDGVPKFVRALKRAGAIIVTDEMINRNQTGAVALRMQQVKNTFTTAYHDLFLSALLGNASIPTLAATHAWNDVAASPAGTGILVDIPRAIYNIKNADADSATGTGVQKFGFNPDTIVINDKLATVLLNNPDLIKTLAVGNVADQQPILNGLYNKTFLGLRVISSWKMNPDKAIIMQSGVTGFYADESPMSATAMYRKEDNQAWRANFWRSSAVGIDQPLSAIVVTGVGGGTLTTANFPAA